MNADPPSQQSRSTAFQRGFSLIEFAVVVCIFTLLIALAMGYAQELSRRYERATLEYQVNRLRASVTMKFAELAMRGELQRMPLLLGENPFDWMEVKPVPYHGLVASTDYARIEPGGWAYDPQLRQVLYRVRNAEASDTPTDDTVLRRFQVRLAGAGRADAIGLTLVSLDAEPPRPE